MSKTIYIDYKNATYWLSYEWFKKHDVPQGTINVWITRDTCRRRMIDGRAYIDYDSVPERTRVKLPTKAEIRKEQSEAYTKETEQTFIELHFTAIHVDDHHARFFGFKNRVTAEAGFRLK